jgi:hypothetical protein
MKPHLLLTYPEGVAAENFDDFAEVVSAKGLGFERRAFPLGGPYAGIEVLLPAAFAVYIAKSYFDGFLNEAGKEHYQALKRGIALLHDKLAPIKTTVIASSAAKSDPNQPFLLTYAVMAEAGEGFTFKFLFRRELPTEMRDRELSCFLTFLASLHDGSLDDATIMRLGEARIVGRTILLAYEVSGDRIVAVDPMRTTAPTTSDAALPS